MATESPALPGRSIVRASWLGTAVFAITAIAATAAPDSLVAVSTPVALVLMAIGIAVFVAAFVRAADRSRTVEIGIGGWFFLAGTAPRRIRLHLMGSLAVEVVVAFATASARPFTPLAFGILAPMYGLSLAGLWGARFGEFGPRVRPAPVMRPEPPAMDQNARHG